MLNVSIEELAYLISGNRPRLEVGYIPHEVCKFFGTAKSTVQLSTESAKHILEEHQGSVEVETAPEKGTTFYLWVPSAQALSLDSLFFDWATAVSRHGRTVRIGESGLQR